MTNAHALAFIERHQSMKPLLAKWKLRRGNLGPRMSKARSKYPPAEPGALGLEPLKAAYRAADAAPERVGHLKVAISATDSSAPGACPPLPVS
jgi:hypothetical protein